MGQNQWYHFGVGAPPIVEPILVGIGMFTEGTEFWVLTHGHIHFGGWCCVSPSSSWVNLSLALSPLTGWCWRALPWRCCSTREVPPKQLRCSCWFPLQTNQKRPDLRVFLRLVDPSFGVRQKETSFNSLLVSLSRGAGVACFNTSPSLARGRHLLSQDVARCLFQPSQCFHNELHLEQNMAEQDWCP